MKLVHLSDIHLGKWLNKFSLLDDQRYILEQILDIIEEEKPDAVLIAGDIYDKAIPSAEAVALLDSFLVRLAERGLPVLASSGNHDSAERLAFANRLLKHSQIYISPVYNGSVQPVTLEDQFGPVDIFLLPFLKPVQVRRFFAEETVETYTDAVACAIRHMPVDPARRSILVAHQFVTGAQRSDSEEVSVGGSDNVDAAVFEGFDYVALGHLHKPQNVDGDRVRYCGTPLKYSFSEARHEKSVTVVELAGKGQRTVRTVPLTPRRDMRELRGSFQEILSPAFYQQVKPEDYIRVILTDEQDIYDAVGQLRPAYPNLMSVDYDNQRTRSGAPPLPEADVQRSPLDLFAGFYEQQNHQSLSEEQRNYLVRLIEEIQEENACGQQNL